MSNATTGWFWLLGGVLIGAAAIVPMKLSHGLGDAKWLLGFLLGATSLLCWTQTARLLPLMTSWMVWEGLGSLGAIMIGKFFFHEAMTLPMILCMMLILIGCAGLAFSVKH